MSYQILCGSERTPLPGCVDAGKLPATHRLRVLLALRQPELDAAAAQLLDSAADGLPTPLSRTAFAARFAAGADDVRAIEAFAAHHGLHVEQALAQGGAVILEGSVQQFDRAFQVDLRDYRNDDLRYRGRTGAVSIPAALHGVVTAVLGLDDRPQARTLPRTLPRARAQDAPPPAAAAPVAQYTPPQLAELYGFPEHDGAGQCIGIIALGGGYARAQLAAYFAELGLPLPQIVDVLLAGARNQPTGQTHKADIEVQMDLQIAGAIAPGAKIVVYFAPNTDNGFLEAIVSAIHDRVHAPDVIAISWGFTETLWTAQSREAYNRALQAAALMGITVCMASGDDGASDGQPGLNVCFPASSPFVLACGGTRLQVDAQATHEQAWPGTGGGQSRVFARPRWQQGLALHATQAAAQPLSMRGVPDVAANADAETGYYVHIDGRPAVMGGTSAAAPLWAALLARIYGLNGGRRVFLPPRLYAAADACRDIVDGSNGGFRAGPGWDACTGLGVPDGARIAALLGAGPGAATAVAKVAD
ncbi:S53 family peptidase [Xanthomonas theicola]|uniref:Peptidase S53 n=1 Tax=Xanthomonas theicola TaxID=56464 RepID=A0A2S6ZD95_9XANT|nr:S53 family peptidase [Xanthomonas theicola]PPT90244.1 peptidase S53 [Xanthomonas theicola]QNH25334.1 S8/S53 family peptidase [Xanthomonas theicola]